MLPISDKTSGFGTDCRSTLVISKEFPYGIGMGGVVLGLFQAFSLRCSQIDEAIRLGDDARVSSLDGSIDALIETIIGYRATNLFYAHMQMQFVGCLIDQYAEDCESVREHVKLLSYLMEQYLGSTVPRWQMPSLERTDRERVERVPAPAAYVPNTDNGNFLNAAILEALPDRVAVLTKDYRYLYANAASSAHVGKKPMEMIGRHIVEFVGEKRFRECIKGLLDSCFAGQACEYVYDRKDEVHVTPTKYRMSPLRDSSGDVIGALILAEDVGSSAATLAA